MVENNTTIYMPGSNLMAKIICGLIIFVSGIIIGCGATVLMVKHRVVWIDKVHKDANEITAKITQKYALTPEQTQKVRQIMDKAFAQKKANDDWMDKQRDDYSAIFISEMNSVMTPDQFAKWNKDFAEMREKFKKHK
jgi:hypothetical protein